MRPTIYVAGPPEVPPAGAAARGRLPRGLRGGIKAGELDWMQAKPMPHGGRRRWLRADVERVIKDRVVKA